jgi:penicillin-insensitive murein endopeptidase
MTCSRLSLALLGLTLVLTLPAGAQDRGTLTPRPLPALQNPDDPRLPAKELFGRAGPSSLPPQAIGGYARGCLAGGAAIPHDGPNWQVMRLSRNRNWGHPRLVAYLQDLAARVPRSAGWPGLLIGDMAQPRGGPMITGHASHQIGLDADIWLTPMPDRRLSRLEREEMSATNMVRSDWVDIDPSVWTPQHLALLRTVASDRQVARVFVNPAIKKALCREAGPNRSWLTKIRPTYGHNYHFHIRLACVAGSPCDGQAPPPPGDGCGADLDYWFRPEVMNPKPSPPRPPLTLAQLPQACRNVVRAP